MLSPSLSILALSCHLICVILPHRDLLSLFGTTAPATEIDYYVEYNRRHGLVYTAETDPEILAEEAHEVARFEEEERRSRGATKDSGSTEQGLGDVNDSDSEWDELSGEGDGARDETLVSKTSNIVERVGLCIF